MAGAFVARAGRERAGCCRTARSREERVDRVLAALGMMQLSEVRRWRAEERAFDGVAFPCCGKRYHVRNPVTLMVTVATAIVERLRVCFDLAHVDGKHSIYDWCFVSPVLCLP